MLYIDNIPRTVGCKVTDLIEFAGQQNTASVRVLVEDATGVRLVVMFKDRQGGSIGGPVITVVPPGSTSSSLQSSKALNRSLLSPYLVSLIFKLQNNVLTVKDEEGKTWYSGNLHSGLHSAYALYEIGQWDEKPYPRLAATVGECRDPSSLHYYWDIPYTIRFWLYRDYTEALVPLQCSPSSRPGPDDDQQSDDGEEVCWAHVTLEGKTSFTPVMNISGHQLALSWDKDFGIVIPHGHITATPLPADTTIPLTVSIKRSGIQVFTGGRIILNLQDENPPKILKFKGKSASEKFMLISSEDQETTTEFTEAMTTRNHELEDIKMRIILGLNAWNFCIIIGVTIMLLKLHNMYKILTLTRMINPTSEVSHEITYEELNKNVASAMNRASIMIHKNKSEDEEEENEYDIEWNVNCFQREELEDLYEQFHDMKEKLDRKILEAKMP